MTDGAQLPAGSQTLTIPGVHHITAIASDPQANIDFYVKVLGLRLVKRTVNFDDPGTYHLYYGDRTGRPGTILTFFPWPGAYRARAGTGQVFTICFAIPRGSAGEWKAKLEASSISLAQSELFGDKILSFSDPDGMALQLAETDIPAGDSGICGFGPAVLAEEGYESTARLLTETFGFRLIASDGPRFRFTSTGTGPGNTVDLLCTPDLRAGTTGAGIVHHIAWRTPDDATQLAWREKLAGLGYNVTPVMNRNYFQSIYFREPGGVLFEIATDAPGFLVDEDVENLGRALKLPPEYESLRSRIESVLPPITVP